MIHESTENGRQRVSAISPSIISRIVHTIADKCRPERIVLFGSSVTGRMHPGSDVDLLVVMNTSLPRYRRSAMIRLLFDPYPCPMDILVYTPEEVRKWNGVTNHIVTEVFSKGKVVYERT